MYTHIYLEVYIHICTRRYMKHPTFLSTGFFPRKSFSLSFDDQKQMRWHVQERDGMEQRPRNRELTAEAEAHYERETRSKETCRRTNKDVGRRAHVNGTRHRTGA